MERIPCGTAMCGTQLSLRNSPETAFTEMRTPETSTENSFPRTRLLARFPEFTLLREAWAILCRGHREGDSSIDGNPSCGCGSLDF